MNDPEPEPDRLQKTLSAAGYGSRRVCEILIAEGRVTVNGEVALLGRRADPETDTIEVDGAPVATRAGLVHYLLNKPRSVVSTADDPEGRQKVTDLVPRDPRVYPVGRLDFDSEGLIIVTNDGDLTNRLTHPSYGVEKEYLVHLASAPSKADLGRLRKGVELDDGVTAPAKVGSLSPEVIRIVIHEGRNRQIRRMCDAVGHPVMRLVRQRIGPLSDPNLAPGNWRSLDVAEVRALAEATQGIKPKMGPSRRR